MLFQPRYRLAAALLIGVGAQVAIDYHGEPKTADEVIQLLLAETRPFESRISGQPHLLYSVTRGPSEPGISFGLLAGQMSRLGATTYRMGQFHLLEERLRQQNAQERADLQIERNLPYWT